MRYHYIYFIELRNGTYYIGKRTTPEDIIPEEDNYYGSPKDRSLVSFDKVKRKFILEECNSREELSIAECAWHKAYNVGLNPKFINLANANLNHIGFSTFGIPMSQSQRDNVSKAKRGTKLSEEHKRNIGIGSKETGMYGRKQSEQQKEKSRQKMLGRKPVNRESTIYIFHNMLTNQYIQGACADFNLSSKEVFGLSYGSLQALPKRESFNLTKNGWFCHSCLL